VPSRGVANAVANAGQRRRAVAHELRDPVFRRACACAKRRLRLGPRTSDLACGARTRSASWKFHEIGPEFHKPRTWHAARAQRIVKIARTAHHEPRTWHAARAQRLRVSLRRAAQKSERGRGLDSEQRRG